MGAGQSTSNEEVVKLERELKNVKKQRDDALSDQKTKEEKLRYSDVKLNNKYNDFYLGSKGIIESGFGDLVKKLDEKKNDVTAAVDGKRKRSKKNKK